MILIAPGMNSPVYVVAWFAHGDYWVEVARLPNDDDARAIVRMFNTGLSKGAVENGESYSYFRLADFDTVVSRS